MYNAFNVVNFRLDVLLLAQFVSASTIGLYSIAVAVTEAVLFIPKGLTNVILSSTSKHGKVSSEAIRILSSFVLATIVSVALVSPWVVPQVFGEEFTASVPALLLLLPGTFFLSMGVVGAYALFGLERGQFAAKAAILGASLTVLLNVILIPYYGIIGAAVSSSLAYFAFGIYIYHKLEGELRVKSKYLLTPDFNIFSTVFTILRSKVAKGGSNA